MTAPREHDWKRAAFGERRYDESYPCEVVEIFSGDCRREPVARMVPNELDESVVVAQRFSRHFDPRLVERIHHGSPAIPREFDIWLAVSGPSTKARDRERVRGGRALDVARDPVVHVRCLLDESLCSSGITPDKHAQPSLAQQSARLVQQVELVECRREQHNGANGNLGELLDGDTQSRIAESPRYGAQQRWQLRVVCLVDQDQQRRRISQREFVADVVDPLCAHRGQSNVARNPSSLNSSG
ncbi:MAG: hypothetical protein U0269_14445 [Polyangiales bacterium]